MHIRYGFDRADTRLALMVLVLTAAVLVIVIVIERFACMASTNSCPRSVDWDGMIQSHARSSTSTSTSTKNSQNKVVHQSRRRCVVNFWNRGLRRHW